ncbi:MAG: hypothetical protein R2695_14190 [Acidimicrobiales bacterium]
MVTPDPQRQVFLAGFDGLFLAASDRESWWSIETLADYVSGLSVSPDFVHDRSVVLATYVKGAFVSTDGGDSWALANNGLEVAEVGGQPLRAAAAPAQHGVLARLRERRHDLRGRLGAVAPIIRPRRLVGPDRDR